MDEMQEKIAKVLGLMERPTMLGPALAELGNDDHAAWSRGWDAATRFFRAHLTDAVDEHGPKT